jgi:uncharacterized protein YceK
MNKLSSKVLIVALTGVIVVSVGCNSAKMRTDYPKPMVYPGLKYTSDANATWRDHSLRWVDFPFSLAVDTVFLPIDLVRVALYKPEATDEVEEIETKPAATDKVEKKETTLPKRPAGE